MKLLQFFAFSAAFALCFASFDVIVQDTSNAATFVMDGFGNPHISIPKTAGQTVALAFAGANSDTCSFPGVEGQSIFTETTNSIELKSGTQVSALLACQFAQRVTKRGYTNIANDAAESDYNILSNTLQITKTISGSSIKIGKDIKLWYPKSVIARQSVTINGAPPTSFVESASASVVYNPTGANDQKWTITVTVVPKLTYSSSSSGLSGTVSGERELSGLSQAEGSNNYVFTVSGDCTGWTFSSGSFVVSRGGNTPSDSQYTTTETINLNLATVDACPLSQGYDFGTPVVDLLGTDDTVRTQFTLSDTAKFRVTLSSPSGITLTYSIASICLDDESSAACSSSYVGVTPGGEPTSASPTATIPVSSISSTPGTVGVKLTIAVGVNGKKRSVVLRTARTSIHIASDEADSSPASKLSVVPFLLLIVFAFLT